MTGGDPASAERYDDDPDGGAEHGRSRPKKAPNAFRTISEVADELHIPQHVLRFWETKFPQVKPLKRGGGRRYYRPDDIALLRGISDLLSSVRRPPLKTCNCRCPAWRCRRSRIRPAMNARARTPRPSACARC